MFGLFKKQLKTINKKTVSEEIKNFKSMGISSGNNIIVSLTSFPERMYEIHYTLYSLLNQSVKPEKVILWLAQDQFPNKENDIPQEVLNLKENGLEIEWCENLYSYKKLVPALKKYPNKIIVTADDDIFYDSNWLEILIKSHNKYPDAIICHRAHRVKIINKQIAPYKKWKKKYKGYKPSYLNFFTGIGGVLYPIGSLYKDVTDKNLFTSLAPKADDIWFWAMALLKHTKIMVSEDNIVDLKYLNPARERGLTNEITLFSTNKKGGNDIQLAKVIEHYPEIINIINSQPRNF